MEVKVNNIKSKQMNSRNACIYEFDDEDIQDDAQSTLMPYYEDEYEDAPIEVNDDAYWDVYFDPTVPDILNRSFSD